MKKLLLIPVILASSMLLAQDYKYEITPVIGYNIAEGNLDLKNQFLKGVELQFNDCDTYLKPELSILHTDADYENSNISTDIYRIAINGVREFDTMAGIIPLAKVGFGYETMDKHLAQNSDSAFIDAGVGAKVPFTDAIALKVEALYMLKNSHSRWDSNLALLAGLNFAFGQKAQPEPIDGDDDNDGVLNSVDKCPNTPAGTKVDASGCKIDGDDDQDGVLNSKDKCPNTPYGTKVDANGCKIDGDDDKDGVLNSVDKCPNSKAGAKVDASGCEIVSAKIMEVKAPVCPPKINLHINFKFDSAVIKEGSLERVDKFSDFLKCTPDYKAQIIGHTDSKGSEAYNIKLSQRRADAVRNRIIENGVSPEKVTTSARGESEPIATNKTREGRAQNRRIEAQLTKN